MKNDKLYPIYISYLENKKMNKGSFKLSQMSEYMFNDFVTRYENNPFFREKQDSIFKYLKRDNTIDDIIEDFEIVIDDINIKTSKGKTDISEYFFDF
jgi:hypothetical protein